MTRTSDPSNSHGTLQGGARGRKWWPGLRKGRVDGVGARLDEDKWPARRLTIRRRGQDQVPGRKPFFGHRHGRSGQFAAPPGPRVVQGWSKAGPRRNRNWTVRGKQVKAWGQGLGREQGDERSGQHKTWSRPECVVTTVRRSRCGCPMSMRPLGRQYECCLNYLCVN